jgi:enolase
MFRVYSLKRRAIMSQFAIKEVIPRQVFDSRANPTVEVDIILENGVRGRGIVPSGASTGIYEAVELRDGDPAYLGGRGVKKALANIEKVLAPALIGKDPCDQAGIDAMMIALDGTPNKGRLGANAILGCSIAAAYAAAKARRLPLFAHLGGVNARTVPVPMIQIIGGGAHAVNSVDVQDFLVIPMSAPSFSAGFEMAVNVYNAVKKVFTKAGKPLAVADEGGFWPTGFKTNEEGLALLAEGIKTAGYEPGRDIAIALDIASSEFYDRGKKTYTFKLENREFSSSAFTDLLCEWTEKYPVISIEDGCSELDWEGSEMLTKKLGKKIQLIGDDLFTTNIERIREGVRRGACNAVLIKTNQIGSLTETLDAVEFTKNSGYLPVISARSGETGDAIIVHIAIASNAGQLKVGSVARGERSVKWNETLRMEEYLGKKGIYPSGELFRRITG